MPMQDPLIKRAYQITLQQYRKEQREKREKERILSWARGDNWDFSRQIKIPNKLRYPTTLDDNPDRGTWGNLLGKYLTDLYRSSPKEAEEINTSLLRACRLPSATKMTTSLVTPMNSETLSKPCPPIKPLGPMGSPSQLTKALHFQHIRQLAGLFTALANDLDYRPDTRPDEWNNAVAILLPKEPGALTSSPR